MGKPSIRIIQIDADFFGVQIDFFSNSLAKVSKQRKGGGFCRDTKSWKFREKWKASVLEKLALWFNYSPGCEFKTFQIHVNRSQFTPNEDANSIMFDGLGMTWGRKNPRVGMGLKLVAGELKAMQSKGKGKSYWRYSPCIPAGTIFEIVLPAKYEEEQTPNWNITKETK